MNRRAVDDTKGRSCSQCHVPLPSGNHEVCPNCGNSWTADTAAVQGRAGPKASTHGQRVAIVLLPVSLLCVTPDWGRIGSIPWVAIAALGPFRADTVQTRVLLGTLDVLLLIALVATRWIRAAASPERVVRTTWIIWAATQAIWWTLLCYVGLGEPAMFFATSVPYLALAAWCLNWLCNVRPIPPCARA